MPQIVGLRVLGPRVAAAVRENDLGRIGLGQTDRQLTQEAFMNRIRILISTAVLTLGAAGCGSSSGPNESLAGTWQIGDGNYAVYRADGTFAVGTTTESAESSPFVWGTYTFDGEIFNVTNAPDDVHCKDSTGTFQITGTYEVELEEGGGAADFTLIEDACTDRTESVGNRWVSP
jgi:hypothetical protein